MLPMGYVLYRAVIITPCACTRGKAIGHVVLVVIIVVVSVVVVVVHKKSPDFRI